MEYQRVRYESIEVFYTEDLDGGGPRFGQDYIGFVRDNFGRVDRIFEWCAGPGFIGFSLLAHNLCHSLCLADINPKAIEACRETICRNNLDDRVSLYLSDGLDSIPPEESWDLVVGNPPHSGTDQIFPEWGPAIKYMDEGWSVHRKFYESVRSHLRPGASVVIQENGALSTVQTFRPMIEAGGLTVIRSENCRMNPKMYYVWSKPIRHWESAR